MGSKVSLIKEKSLIKDSGQIDTRKRKPRQSDQSDRQPLKAGRPKRAYSIDKQCCATGEFECNNNVHR
jgi:hypothetical protein